MNKYHFVKWKQVKVLPLFIGAVRRPDIYMSVLLRAFETFDAHLSIPYTYLSILYDFSVDARKKRNIFDAQLKIKPFDQHQKAYSSNYNMSKRSWHLCDVDGHCKLDVAQRLSPLFTLNCPSGVGLFSDT